MIARHTGSVPTTEDFPRMPHRVSRCFQAYRRRSQASGWCSQMFPWLSPRLLSPLRFVAGTPRCTWSPLRWSNKLRVCTTPLFWSDNSNTLPETEMYLADVLMNRRLPVGGFCLWPFSVPFGHDKELLSIQPSLHSQLPVWPWVSLLGLSYLYGWYCLWPLKSGMC